MADFKVLSDEEIKNSIDALSEWKVIEGKLQAEYTFSDFRTAFAFMTLVAIESEKVDHHPEWSNTYNKVHFSFSTHDAGDKITDLDVQMARYISETARKFL